MESSIYRWPEHESGTVAVAGLVRRKGQDLVSQGLGLEDNEPDSKDLDKVEIRKYAVLD